VTTPLPVADKRWKGPVAAVAKPVAFHGANVGYRVRNQLVWLGELLA
jgi:hypothetical protein